VKAIVYVSAARYVELRLVLSTEFTDTQTVSQHLPILFCFGTQISITVIHQKLETVSGLTW